VGEVGGRYKEVVRESKSRLNLKEKRRERAITRGSPLFERSANKKITSRKEEEKKRRGCLKKKKK